MIFPPLRLPAHSSSRGGSERLYTFLRPTACGAGEGHEVARGRIAKGTLPAAAMKEATHTSKGRHLHLPFTIFSGPLPPLSWSPSPRQAVGGKFRGKGARLRRTASRHYAYLPTPIWGWVASGARRKGAASAGSYKNGATYFQRVPPSFTIYNLQFFSGPLPPLRGPPPPGKQGKGKFLIHIFPYSLKNLLMATWANYFHSTFLIFLSK